jgi:hypothetical protein
MHAAGGWVGNVVCEGVCERETVLTECQADLQYDTSVTPQNISTGS